MRTETLGVICGVRLHGEHGAIVRILTNDFGLMAGYVRGARSRTLRPVLISANDVIARFTARTPDQLPSLTMELAYSRAPLMQEPLAAAGLDWVTALAAVALPENHPYPSVCVAMKGILAAIEAAPSARRWAGALAQYEELIMAATGFGAGEDGGGPSQEWEDILTRLERNRARLERDVLNHDRRNIIAARDRLIVKLKRAAG